MSDQLRTRRPEHGGQGMNIRLACLVFWGVMAGPWIVASTSASTIAEIALIAEGGHATADQVVILSTVDLAPDPGWKSFQVRDLTRAMTVYGTNAEIDAALTGFGAGGVIEISGYTARLDGALILTTGGTVGGFAVSGRTSTLPIVSGALAVSPPDIAASYESQLVCLQNVSFDTSGGSDVFAAETNFDLLEGGWVRVVGGDQGVIGQPIPIGPVNITGIVIPDPAGDGYCLAPRGPDDIVSVPEPASLVLLVLGGFAVLRRRRSFGPGCVLACLLFVCGLGIVPPASASTIAEIDALPEGTSVTTDAVVILSTTDLVADPGLKSFQIRDTTRAMTIYGTNAEIDAALTGFGTGDIIDIAGRTARLDGALMLFTGGTIGGFAVSGRTSSNPMPNNAVFVAPGDIAESYESNLVCLQNVSFTDSGVFMVGTEYALAGNSALVRIATSELGLAGYPIPAGLLDITGIVISDPSGNGYCLAPRGPGDIASVPEPTSLVLLVLGGFAVTRGNRTRRRLALPR